MSIEAMKQALEALDSDNPDIQLRAAILLRTAIAEAKKQEPVAYQLRHSNIDNGKWYEIDLDRYSRATADFERRALYTHSPAAQRQPLTDEQLLDAFCATPGIHQFVQAFTAGARFAEAAHGITGESK